MELPGSEDRAVEFISWLLEEGMGLSGAVGGVGGRYIPVVISWGWMGRDQRL